MSDELTIRWFAAARDAAGCEVVCIPYVPGERVVELRKRLQAEAGNDRLRWLIGVARLATHDEFRSDDEELQAGDEVLVLPPSSGGTVRARLVELPIEPGAVERALENPAAGAVVTFTGNVRATNLGHEVDYLEYSAYAPLAHKEMEAIGGEAMARWSLVDAVLVHRIGRLQVGETAVVVGVSAPHRSEAFAACAWMIDELKKRVPIWKKEVTTAGETWIGSTP